MTTVQLIPREFYLPENPDNTIVDSALASVQFAVTVCDDPGDGTLRCRSMDAIPDGSVVPFRGRFVDGVGYCTDTVFAANQIIRFADLLSSDELRRVGTRLAAHALNAGFFVDERPPIRMYLDTDTGGFLHNLEAREGYIETGHIARVAHQLLLLSDVIGDGTLAGAARDAAARVVNWVPTLEKCQNGWYPRRSTPDGRVFPFAPDSFGPVSLGGDLPRDPMYDKSGAGVLIIQLLAEAAKRGVTAALPELVAATDVFVSSGGYFGSVNSDTEDLHENVAYAMAFQALRAAADVTGRSDWKEFAYEACLNPLAQFEITEDLNGLETKGLLWMEMSWNSACSWEIAEAAQAYLEAYGERGERQHALKALTMLRGLAKHHHGPHGYLTEAVDWDGHSTITRHFDGKRYSDISTTHPFLNNLHILEPTVTYLERFAQRGPATDGTPAFYDLEGNLLGPVVLGRQPWMNV